MGSQGPRIVHLYTSQQLHHLQLRLQSLYLENQQCCLALARTSQVHQSWEILRTELLGFVWTSVQLPFGKRKEVLYNFPTVEEGVECIFVQANA